jgi:hypothetical protein
MIRPGIGLCDTVQAWGCGNQNWKYRMSIHRLQGYGGLHSFLHIHVFNGHG